MSKTRRNLLTIRMADASDANLLADLGRRTFHETFADSNKAEDMDHYLRATFALDRIVEEFWQKATPFFIAETPTKPVGFAKFESASPPPCVMGLSPVRLHKPYVTADVIGTGVGASLMQFGIAGPRGGLREPVALGLGAQLEGEGVLREMGVPPGRD